MVIFTLSSVSASIISIVVRIRLTRKLAGVLNGLDVSSLRVGDVIELPDSAARMMIAERWAEPVVEQRAPSQTFSTNQPLTAN